MKKLQPQTPQKIKWEQDLIHVLEIELDCTTSDAQAYMEANEDRVNDWYSEELSPKETFKLLLKKL